MKRLITNVSLLLLLAGLANADISAKWKGSGEVQTPDGQTQTVSVSAELKQQGSAVTGTIGKEGEERYSIEKGKVEDKTITFEFQAPEDSQMRLYTVKLTIVNDTQLQGSFEFQAEDNKVTGKLTLAKVQ